MIDILKEMAVVYSFMIFVPPQAEIVAPNPTDWRHGDKICLRNSTDDWVKVRVDITHNNGTSIVLPKGVTRCSEPLS